VRFDMNFLWLISIGDNTTISARVEVLVHDAAFKREVGYSLIAPVDIGADVYIGARAVILPGVTIADGAVIGAGSVVKHNVKTGMIVAGNPAREIGTVAVRVEAQREDLASRPVYSARSGTFVGGITREGEESMRESLRDGHGYIE
jgi:maltose O-acetyltransferase